MTVKEFLEAFHAIIDFYEGNFTYTKKKMLIKIESEHSMGSTDFCSIGEVKMNGNISILELEKPFENVLIGNTINKELKYVAVPNLKVKKWSINKYDNNEDYIAYLNIIVDDKISRNY